MEDFFKANSTPEHIKNILKLAGVTGLADFEEINEEFVSEIEEQVRKSGFKSIVDLTSRQKQILYLGIEVVDIGQFSFRLLDRKKLLALSGLAAQYLVNKNAKLL